MPILHYLFGLYLLLSVVTLLIYAFDKSAVIHGRWRIPEKLLHVLALLGGWPGALAAQRIFRHKSRKHRFLLIFWLTVALNLAALWWLYR